MGVGSVCLQQGLQGENKSAGYKKALRWQCFGGI